MAVCNPQTLLDTNPCLSALDPYTLEVLETQMICGLFNNLDSGEPLTCDIQALLDDADCLYGLSSFQLRVIRTQILCEIGNIL